MLTKHIHTPNYKISNALIIIIWAFRLFLDQPQQLSHGSITTAKPTGTEVNEKNEQSLSGTTFALDTSLSQFYLLYLRCASNIFMLTVRTVGISDRVYSHWRLTSSNDTSHTSYGFCSKVDETVSYFLLNHENFWTAFNHIIKPA